VKKGSTRGLHFFSVGFYKSCNIFTARQNRALSYVTHSQLYKPGHRHVGHASELDRCLSPESINNIESGQASYRSKARLCTCTVGGPDVHITLGKATTTI